MIPLDAAIEADKEVGGSGQMKSANRNGLGTLLRGGALAGVGLGGLLLGGLPLWAARRLIYPIAPEPLPQNMNGNLQIEATALPERVEFASRDGMPLGGWFVPGPPSQPAPWPCILLVYGYGGCKEQMAGYAQMLHQAGFATFLFDMHGSGTRKGDPVSFGYAERWDLMDAAKYVTSRPDVDKERIGVLGVSMGAATALLASADDPSIKAVVSDSSFADLVEMVKPGLKAFLGLPSFPFAPLIVRYAEAMLGMKTSEVKPEEAASRLGERPLMVIHGLDDELIHVASAHRIYNAASGPKEMWLVPNCTHAQAPVVATEEYQRRVNAFFTRWLGAERER